MWAAILAASSIPVISRLFAPIIQAGTRVAGGVMVRWSAAPSWLRRIAIAGGLASGADILIPDSFTNALLPDVIGSSPAAGGGAATHPAQVAKSWSANGVPMVRLVDGRMGAYSTKKTSWKYWRPKKPIVLFGTGASDLRTLLKADRAAERQLKRVKKAIDRRFPPRRRSRREPRTTIIESGPGSVSHGS